MGTFCSTKWNTSQPAKEHPMKAYFRSLSLSFFCWTMENDEKSERGDQTAKTAAKHSNSKNKNPMKSAWILPCSCCDNVINQISEICLYQMFQYTVYIRTYIYIYIFPCFVLYSCCAFRCFARKTIRQYYTSPLNQVKLEECFTIYSNSNVQ